VAKKKESERVEDYRGVTLMPTLYKVYTGVLGERLREEIEGKRIIPPNQTGFRKGMGTMDNVYVLNYLVNKRLETKKGKIIAMFVDLKAAFDSVDREVLICTMRQRGIREGLIERVEEVMRETRSRVKIGDKTGEGFWTARGVRQGCPMSPLLFNVLIADLEEELGRVRWGGIRLGEEVIFSLAYADDIVLLAEEEDEMKSMIDRFERYLGRKRLELNVDKTKVMRFRKGKGRMRKREWWWKGKEIKEVKEFRYLGYMFQKNGGQEAQIRDRIKRAAMVMGQVWGIGKRRYGKDWGRRLWLFDRLVWTVMEYGVEIWGWKEREGMERLEERYLRWMLGVDRRTPGYLVREELQREKLKGRAGRRAWGYEKRLEQGRGNELARKCWEEIKERGREGKKISDWERERERFFGERGMSLEEVERGREGEGEWFTEIEGRERENQRTGRWEDIKESRYNKWYKEIKGAGIPEYLKKGWGESRVRRVARFRLGNEVREAYYWEEEEKRKCRLCGMGEETWEHVWEECRGWVEERSSWQVAMKWVLSEEGEGEWWMRKLEKERKEKEEKVETGGVGWERGEGREEEEE